MPYYPSRGRLAQAVKNDLDYHIFATDEKCNSIPRAFEHLKAKKVSSSMGNRAINAPTKMKKEFASLLKPHSMRFYAGLTGWPIQYVADYQANNYGFLDKDRRIENTDNSLRILLLGECWTEGLQTLVNKHYGVILESILRRKLNRNVEVITYATSNASIGTNSIAYEKYGSKFKPDLTLIFSNNYMTVTMNGNLQKNIIGWDPKHAPYRMFDFDKDGELIKYEADLAYPAFTEPPVACEEGEVQWGHVLSVDNELTPAAQKAIDLSSAVLEKYYVKPSKSHQGKVAVVFGYQPALWTVAKYGDINVNHENFYQRMEYICEEVGASAINLSSQLTELKDAKSPVKVLTWENDDHLSPTGNYIIGFALAQKVLELLKDGEK